MTVDTHLKNRIAWRSGVEHNIVWFVTEDK